MAGIRKKGDSYYCTFRFHGRRFYFTVGNVSEAQARAKGTEVDETLGLRERGRLTVPEGVTLEYFVAAPPSLPWRPVGGDYARVRMIVWWPLQLASPVDPVIADWNLVALAEGEGLRRKKGFFEEEL